MHTDCCLTVTCERSMQYIVVVLVLLTLPITMSLPKPVLWYTVALSTAANSSLCDISGAAALRSDSLISSPHLGS
jgi:hypothetical protein